MQVDEETSSEESEEDVERSIVTKDVIDVLDTQSIAGGGDGESGSVRPSIGHELLVDNHLLASTLSDFPSPRGRDTQPT